MIINNQSNTIQDYNRTDYQKSQIAMNGDAVLSGGIATLYIFMDLLSGKADDLFKNMQKKSEVTREAQSAANTVDSVIAEVSKEGPNGKGIIPTEAYNYMYDNGITVNGKTINEYLGFDSESKQGAGTSLNSAKLNQGELNAIKSALETASNQASDFVSQAQLQIQKVMQTYNVTVSLINSIQTLLADMNKSIAQNIR